MIFITKFKNIFISIIVLSFIIPILFIPSISTSEIKPENVPVNPNGFNWPIPGYTSISSPFGSRTSPTTGAQSYHYGTDIPAPENTPLIAISDGIITHCGFLGPGRVFYYTFF